MCTGVRGKDRSGPAIIYQGGTKHAETMGTWQRTGSPVVKICLENFTLSVNCGAKGSSAKM